MRLISQVFGDNIPTTVLAINDRKLARFVLSINNLSSMTTMVVFRAETYDEYAFICKKLTLKTVERADF